MAEHSVTESHAFQFMNRDVRVAGESLEHRQRRHTPGPWKWGKGVDDDPTRCFVTQSVPDEPTFVIAQIENGAPGDSLETEKAKARLMAEAPALLAACKLALPWIAKVASDHDDEGDPTGLHERAMRAHAFVIEAIAQAEGGAA